MLQRSTVDPSLINSCRIASLATRHSPFIMPSSAGCFTTNAAIGNTLLRSQYSIAYISADIRVASLRVTLSLSGYDPRQTTSYICSKLLFDDGIIDNLRGLVITCLTDDTVYKAKHCINQCF